MIIDLDYINDRIKNLEYKIEHPNYNLTPTIKVKINDGAVYKEELATLKNIKKCILKAEKLEKENIELKEVLKIIKENNIDIELLKYRLRVKDDDVYLHYKYDKLMPREKFNLLKRWVEND